MNASQPQSARASAALRKRCVYCLDNNELCPDQVLLRGDRFYLCAPRGQLVEGYLAIAPYQCAGALSRLPPSCFDELTSIGRLVAAFYREAYGQMTGLLYEQGRAGGGAVFDEVARFPHHAHLCSLPLNVDLHTPLMDEYVQIKMAGPHELFAAVGGNPYLYVECPDAHGEYLKCAYVARSPAGRRLLERSRLKPTIARLVGLPQRGDWRAYPGDRELQRLIRRFGEWSKPWPTSSTRCGA